MSSSNFFPLMWHRSEGVTWSNYILNLAATSRSSFSVSGKYSGWPNQVQIQQKTNTDQDQAIQRISKLFNSAGYRKLRRDYVDTLKTNSRTCAQQRSCVRRKARRTEIGKWLSQIHRVKTDWAQTHLRLIKFGNQKKQARHKFGKGQTRQAMPNSKNRLSLESFSKDCLARADTDEPC